MAHSVALPRLQRNDLLKNRNRSYNKRIATLRKVEYPVLQGNTYLDHAGTTLTSKTLIRDFAEELEDTLLENPHSSSGSAPNASQRIVDATRLQVLELFRADKEHFDVVFVANATAGIKLVVEAFTGYGEGFNYCYHRDSHTSLVGVRELAHVSYCLQSDAEAESWIRGEKSNEDGTDTHRHSLFAYPAQSNMNGRRLPFSWASSLRHSGRHPNTYTLLDVAALVSTSPLDLSDHTVAPDFLTLSFYKMFGFPDLGALIVRKSAAHIFDRRRYFGGGTTGMIICTGQPWVERKKLHLHESLEDGSAPIRNILALRCALRVHRQLFGGFDEISRHTGWLAKRLHDRLALLKHANGNPACRIYQDLASTYGDARTQGATMAFNLCRSDGTWIGSSEVGRLAALNKIYIRTGSLCNPAGMASALGLDAAFLREAYKTGFRCGQEEDVVRGIPLGMVRVSFGAMSTLEDVEVFMLFVGELILGQISGVPMVSMEEGKKGFSWDDKLRQKAISDKPRKGTVSKFASCFG